MLKRITKSTSATTKRGIRATGSPTFVRIPKQTLHTETWLSEAQAQARLTHTEKLLKLNLGYCCGVAAGHACVAHWVDGCAACDSCGAVGGANERVGVKCDHKRQETINRVLKHYPGSRFIGWETGSVSEIGSHNILLSIPSSAPNEPSKRWALGRWT